MAKIIFEKLSVKEQKTTRAGSTIIMNDTPENDCQTVITDGETYVNSVDAQKPCGMCGEYPI